MLTLLTLYGFTDAVPARPALQERATYLARAAAAPRCRFYERDEPQGSLGWTIWIPGFHLVVIAREVADLGYSRLTDFVICHELGHAVLGHARNWRQWKQREAQAEEDADDFAERLTGTPKEIRVCNALRPGV